MHLDTEASVPFLWVFGAIAIPVSFLGSAGRSFAARVWVSLVKLIRSAGIAAWLACVIAQSLPALIPALGGGDLSNETLDELNRRIHELDGWFEYAWIPIVAMTLLLIVVGRLAQVEYSRARIAAANRVVEWTTRVKLLFGLMSCCTFVGAGLMVDLKRVQDAQTKLQALQVRLFEEARRVAVHELLAAHGVPVPRVGAAYKKVRQYLPEARTAGRPSPPAQRPPDVSTRQAEAVEREISTVLQEDNGGLESTLAAEIAEGPVKDGLLYLLLPHGNTLVKESVGALVEPPLDRLKKWIDRRATQIASRGRTQAGEPDIPEDFGTLVGPARALGTLGDPRWEGVRDKLKEQPRFRSLPAMREFDEFREALDQLVQNRDESQPVEHVFAEYLGQKREMAALWGYGVVAFTPDGGSEELWRLSASAKRPRIESALERMLAKASADADAAEFVRTADPRGLLSTPSTDDPYTKWIAIHGPYAVDGYDFYLKETGYTDAERKKLISDFETYCPTP